MIPGSGQTLHHPRWLRQPISTWWWLRKWSYFKFILREISSLFVAWTVILILLHIAALRRGPEAFAALQAWLAHPAVLGLSVITFLFTLIHSFTWLNLAPKAMALRIGQTRVPPAFVAAGHYVAWFSISVALGWILSGG